MAEGISVYDLMPAKPKDDSKKVVKGKGLSVASLTAQPPKPAEPSAQTPFSGFVDRTVSAVKKAGSEFTQNPEDTTLAAGKALWDGAKSMITLSASGVGALAKSMVTPVKIPPGTSAQDAARINFDSSIASFTANQEKIEGALKDVNEAPMFKQEEAMQNLLNIIPDGIKATGDTVYDKTGSALAASSAQALATLLTLSPDIATRVMRRVSETAKAEAPAAPLSSAFDQMSAKHPEEAKALADHVEQVDPKTARYMKKRWDHFKEASDEELSKLGKAAAEASINELTADFDVIKGTALADSHGLQVGEGKASPGRGRKSGPADPLIPPPDTTGLSTGEGKASKGKGGPSGPAEPLVPVAPIPKPITAEQVSATIRTAAKEGLEAISAPEPVVKVGTERLDMTKTKEERALERERVAAVRAREEGIERTHEPEPVPPRAAEHEGEISRRKAADPEAFETEPATNANGALYLSSGIPITRQAVEGFFRVTTDLTRKVPGVAIAEAKMSRLYQGFIEMFNPEAKGAPAKTAGAAIARNFFQQAMKEHSVWELGKQRREYWMKMGDKAGMDFINQFEKGRKFANPIWEKARLKYKDWAADIFKQDMKTGFTYDPVDHYMPHLFEDGDGVMRFMQKRYGNRWADPRFIKERGYDLYAEAVEAGFSPKFRSPEDIMQARQHASDIAALRTDLLAELERKGVAQKAVKGETRPPDGFSPNSRRSPTGQRYWVRSEADALMHNAFDSQSLWNLQGSAKNRAISSGFRGWMGVKNALIPIKLGLSLFHPMHVLHIDASATLTRATKSMLGNPSLGTIKDFMINSATAYLQPLWTNPRLGSPLLKTFQGKLPFEKLSDADKVAFKDLAEGGMVPTRPREETSGAVQKFKDAITRRSPKVLVHAPFAALAALSHPLFGVWIPDLKIASYLKDVKAARELNPQWSDSARQEAFRQIARKVEARYGEMNYNSLFMDKMLKDIGVATNLSLGWNLGLLDQYVGGAIDGVRSGKNIAMDLIDPESKGSSVKKELAGGGLDRPIFAAYYITSAMMIGGLMHYMFTGQKPDQLIDYTHPKSGEKDEHGKDVRLNTMFYTREFEGLYKHMQQEGIIPGITDFVSNKGSGLMEMSRAALTGVDSLGQEIRDPEAPAYKQFEQTLFSTLGGLEPISLEAIEKSTGNKAKSMGMSVLGFTPAGKYISETVMEGTIANDYNKYVRPKEKPFQGVEMAKDVKELRELYKKDDPKYDIKLDGVAAKYQMDDKDIRRLQRGFASPKEDDFDPSVFMFSKLPWEVQKPLIDRMSPEERETFMKGISKAKRSKWEREHAEETEGAT
jgi:hypothetical protein